MRKYFGATAIAACVLLSACGEGGGVNSTPAPAPSPSPSPSPSPTPSANTSLVGPLVSESFANNAATATVSYTGNALGTTTAGVAPPLTVRYDASNQSYTIVTGATAGAPSRTQTFRPANIDNAQSSSGAVVYEIDNGSTTDSLTLTRPGTSGSLHYQYVGSGYWQRTISTGSSVDGSFDAFAYGVQTPNAATPRTGSGLYSIEVLGVLGTPDQLVAGLYGTGTLTADFASGHIALGSTVTATDQGGASLFTLDMSGSANISSASNAFTGTAQMSHFTGTLVGGLNGAFYGPHAEEIGAAFGLRSSAGYAAVGTIMGRQGNGETLATLGAPRTLENLTNAAVDTRTTWTTTNPPTIYASVPPAVSLITIDPATHRYTLDHYGTASYSYDDSNKSVAESNARFTVYHRTGDARGPSTLRLYNPGSGNDELALTYTSFGELRVDAPAGGAYANANTQDQWLVFGLKTDLGVIPTSGNATYNGVMYGTAYDAAHLYDVTGTSQFLVDFGSGNISARLASLLTPMGGGTAISPAAWNFTGTWHNSANSFDLLGSGNAGDANGRVKGSFYGPSAQEIGAAFDFDASGPVFTGHVSGVTAAKR